MFIKFDFHIKYLSIPTTLTISIVLRVTTWFFSISYHITFVQHFFSHKLNTHFQRFLNIFILTLNFFNIFLTIQLNITRFFLNLTWFFSISYHITFVQHFFSHKFNTHFQRFLSIFILTLNFFNIFLTNIAKYNMSFFILFKFNYMFLYFLLIRHHFCSLLTSYLSLKLS